MEQAQVFLPACSPACSPAWSSVATAAAPPPTAVAQGSVPPTSLPAPRAARGREVVVSQRSVGGRWSKGGDFRKNMFRIPPSKAMIGFDKESPNKHVQSCSTYHCFNSCGTQIPKIWNVVETL